MDEDPATYEQLAELEREFEDVETQIVAHQHTLTQPLYTKRAAVVAKIPGFWPLVFEQAPEEIDQYIQPSDSEILASCLTSFSVSRPDAPARPRNVTLRFEFGPSDFFKDTVLEKVFQLRTLDGGEKALVSAPVLIKWKEGKDLTNGLLEKACALHEAVLKAGTEVKEKELKEYKALKAQVEKEPEGAQSFFAWFGYRGPWISQEASDANEAKVKAGGKPKNDANGADEDEDMGLMDEDEEELEAEIFPDGDDLALALSEDLWPNALRYFADAQTQDELDMEALADMEDAEMDGEDDEEDVEVMDIRSLVKDSQRKDKGGGAGADAPPKKKRKT